MMVCWIYYFNNYALMRKFRLFIIMVLGSLAVVSCDDEIFGPRSLEGTWRVTENSDAFGRQNFLAGIEYYPGDDSRIIIGNFSDLDMAAEVVANVNGLNITIPSQTVQDSHSNNFRISGSGVASSNMRRINFTYGIDGDNFDAVFEKQ